MISHINNAKKDAAEDDHDAPHNAPDSIITNHASIFISLFLINY